MPKPSPFTLGIEEELQVVNLDSMALERVPLPLLRTGLAQFHEHLHREMHESTVEITSEILPDIEAAERSVRQSRGQLAELLKTRNLGFASAGTHPFSSWKTQKTSDTYRHREVLREFRYAVRSFIIYGLHVHVGMADRAAALQIANASYSYLPLILALSSNSPFWEGVDTGFKSFRADYFLQLPRTGLPHRFETIADYDAFIDTLVRCGSIDNPKKTYWDIRIHPFFPTIEFRICDAQSHWRDTLAMVAMVQGLVARIHRDIERGVPLPRSRRALATENRFRASIDGIHGAMIDVEKQTAMETGVLIDRMFDYIEEVVDDLGLRSHIEHARKLRAEGTGADRQVDIFEKTLDLHKVARHLHEESNDDLLPPPIQ